MRHQNKKFSGKTIDLDFNEFVGCQFADCEFIYHGAGRVEMSGCEFTNVTWKFSDGAANTLSFMRAMYHGAGKGGQELVDRVFQNLKQP